VVDPMIAHTLLKPDKADSSTPAKKLSMLSLQERKVLEEVATGKTDKEIAEPLGLRNQDHPELAGSSRLLQARGAYTNPGCRPVPSCNKRSRIASRSERTSDSNR
jgi:FixJ family two-component response regulator